MQGINLITSRLEVAGIVYCLVGGLAAIAYGRPRLTLDADLVIALHPGQLTALSLAFPIEEFYLPPHEVLLAEMQRDHHGRFNILHQISALRADCYLPGKNTLSLWELRHRRQMTSPDGPLWFAPPESVIIHKLIYFREGKSEKHLDDIRSILSAQSDLDTGLLHDWISHQNLQSEWATVLKG